MAVSKLVKGLISIYRLGISPGLHLIFGAGAGCRFEPTCSVYCEECFNRLPWYQAVYRSIVRILKCHPWSRGGFDPVTPTLYDSELKPKV